MTPAARLRGGGGCGGACARSTIVADSEGTDTANAHRYLCFNIADLSFPSRSGPSTPRFIAASLARSLESPVAARDFAIELSMRDPTLTHCGFWLC